MKPHIRAFLNQQIHFSDTLSFDSYRFSLNREGFSFLDYWTEKSLLITHRYFFSQSLIPPGNTIVDKEFLQEKSARPAVNKAKNLFRLAWWTYFLGHTQRDFTGHGERVLTKRTIIDRPKSWMDTRKTLGGCCTPHQRTDYESEGVDN